MQVQVYRNLHRNCWSVRHNGRVIDHVDSISLRDAKLVVQPAGRAKVLKENRKNVHAYIKGTIDTTNSLKPRPTKITYNPYKYSSFVVKDTEEPIYYAEYVHLNKYGAGYIN